ncbi:MAG: hypothetical protein V4760_04140 [Bdellovibrionota bacterium]
MIIVGALIFVFLSGFASTSKADVAVDLDPIGKHHRIFRFEKNENPQNILIGYTRLTGECRFERQGETPSFDFYWLLDGKRFKNPHNMIKKNIRKRFASVDAGPRKPGETDVFKMRLIESKEMKTSLKDATIRVSASKSKEGCEVKTVASFRHPEDGSKTIELKTIRSETKKTWMPPFRKILSITLEGESVKDGKLVTQVFK